MDPGNPGNPGSVNYLFIHLFIHSFIIHPGIMNVFKWSLDHHLRLVKPRLNVSSSHIPIFIACSILALIVVIKRPFFGNKQVE